MKQRGRLLLLNGFLLATACATLVPIVWMISVSFMPNGEASTFPPRFLPSRFTWDNYRDLFARLNLGRYFLNSALVSTGITLISLFLNSMAGYAFAKLRFPGRDRVFATLLAALVIPAQIAMLPLFLMLREAGLVNSYWGVIIPAAANIFGVFLIRQYALSLPEELIDAARVDGAGEFKIYWSVVVPMCKPVLVTLAVFTFLGAWNDFLWPLIILTNDQKYTLPVALANLVGEHVQDTEIMMAGATVTILPVILVFLFLQRFYLEGISKGATKE